MHLIFYSVIGLSTQINIPPYQIRGLSLPMRGVQLSSSLERLAENITEETVWTEVTSATSYFPLAVTPAEISYTRLDRVMGVWRSIIITKQDFKALRQIISTLPTLLCTVSELWAGQGTGILQWEKAKVTPARQAQCLPILLTPYLSVLYWHSEIVAI